MRGVRGKSYVVRSRVREERIAETLPSYERKAKRGEECGLPLGAFLGEQISGYFSLFDQRILEIGQSHAVFPRLYVSPLDVFALRRFHGGVF